MHAYPNKKRGRTVWISDSYWELFSANGLRAMDDLFEIEPNVKFEKASLPDWRKRVAVDLGVSGEKAERFYIKRFGKPPFFVQMKRVLSGQAFKSTAGVERYWIETLKRDGISVPSIAAFGEERCGVLEKRSVLALAEVEGISLESWVKLHPQRAPRRLIELLAKFAARFHALGYIHRDFYLCHIFINREDSCYGDIEDCVFTLIDLQRIMRKPIRRKRWLARELAQLNYSVPETVAGLRDRLRFLKAYLSVSTLKRSEVRDLMSRIEAKTLRIAAHDRKLQARKNDSGDLG